MTAVGKWDVAYAPYTTNGYKWVIVTNAKGQERIWMITQVFSMVYKQNPEHALEKMWDAPMSFDLDWSVFEDEAKDERAYMAELYVRTAMVSELYLTGQATEENTQVTVEAL